MKIISGRLFIISTLYIMCIFSLTSLIACSKPIDKVGYHLEEIKDIDYKLSLKKIDAMLAAEKIMKHLQSIEKLNYKIQNDEPIKEYLDPFVKKWNSKELIFASLTDERRDFMQEVSTFFMRGYVKTREGWKTLFPIFKP